MTPASGARARRPARTGLGRGRRAADRAALNEFYRSNYPAMQDWAGRAVRAAKVLGDGPLLAAALAMPALADAMTGASERARSHRADAAALVDSLSDGEPRSALTRRSGWLPRSSTSTATPRPTSTPAVP